MKKSYDLNLKLNANRIKLYAVFLLLNIFLFKSDLLHSQTGLITNVVSTTGHSYTLGQLTVGTTIYSDRTYQVTTVPSYLNGADFIKTANDDKNNKTTSALSFNLTQNATV